MKQPFFYILLFFLVYTAKSQNKSFSHELSKSENQRDAFRAFIKHEKLISNKCDSVLPLLLQLLNHFTKRNNDTGIAFTNNRIARLYHECSIYDSSLAKIDIALQMFKKLQNDTMFTMGLIRKGFTYYTLGNYEKAIQNYLEAAEKAKQIARNDRIASAYNLTGLAYYAKPKPEYRKALSYYYEAIKYTTDRRSGSTPAYIYSRIGTAYMKLKLYDSSEIAMKLSNKIADSLKIKDVSAWTNEALGNLKKNMQKHEESKLIYKKVLKKFLEIKENPGIIIAYRNLAENDTALHNYKSANVYIDSAIYYSLSTQVLQTLPEIYYIKSDICFKLANYQQAYKYHILYSGLQDSLFGLQNSRNMADIESKYQTNQKNKEITFLNQQKQLDKKIRNILIAAVSAALILIILVIFFLFKTIKSRKTLQQKNSEIQLQKQLLEEKQTEILASIRYAKRIQESLLPTEKFIFKKLINKN